MLATIQASLSKAGLSSPYLNLSVGHWGIVGVVTRMGKGVNLDAIARAVNVEGVVFDQALGIITWPVK